MDQKKNELKPVDTDVRHAKRRINLVKGPKSRASKAEEPDAAEESEEEAPEEFSDDEMLR